VGRAAARAAKQGQRKRGAKERGTPANQKRRHDHAGVNRRVSFSGRALRHSHGGDDAGAMSGSRPGSQPAVQAPHGELATPGAVGSSPPRNHAQQMRMKRNSGAAAPAVTHRAAAGPHKTAAHPASRDGSEKKEPGPDRHRAACPATHGSRRETRTSKGETHWGTRPRIRGTMSAGESAASQLAIAGTGKAPKGTKAPVAKCQPMGVPTRAFHGDAKNGRRARKTRSGRERAGAHTERGGQQRALTDPERPSASTRAACQRPGQRAAARKAWEDGGGFARTSALARPPGTKGWQDRYPQQIVGAGRPGGAKRGKGGAAA